MSCTAAALVVAGLLAGAPVVSAQRATHATTGTVTSVNETTLVIARPGTRGQMTFILEPTTHREGTVAVDAPVSVRYREDGGRHIATAVTAQNRRPPDAAHKPPAR